MSLTVRRARERGIAEFDWLKSKHTFSFGDYYDPRFMGWGPLRVINEDRVEPGRGFATHSHQNMEILSWVLEGALQHKDSLGTTSVIKPGELQRMTAGTGVTHSEFNPSQRERVHFLQIWILPEKSGLRPGYEQRAFGDLDNRLRLVASHDGRDGSVLVQQDADMWAARLRPGARVSHRIAPRRLGWVQVAKGSVATDSVLLETGDGAAITGPAEIALESRAESEILLFDMTP